MKDVQKLFDECMAELRSIGIVPDPIRSVTVNTRATRRWGQASKIKGMWEISISDRLLADDLPDRPAKNVLMHEILHCRWNGGSHIGYWSALAEKVNKELGYSIHSHDSRESLGLPPISEEEKKALSKRYKGAEIRDDGRIVRYIVECPCGNRVERSKMSRLIQHPEDYRCRKCGGTFRRVK